jgi:tetratricopeptide (TPR) repeat protein
MDNYPQAITYYSRYLEQAPDLKIRQLRAMAYAAIDSINLAIKDIDICLQPNANDTSLWMSKGNIYYDANRFREAIDAYNVILLLYPKHKEALYNRADAYSNLGVFELAILDYQSLLSIGRNEADYHFNIGFCQIQLKQNEAAIMSLNKAIDLEFPDFGLLLTLRGVAYNNLKLQAEACSDWKHALQIGYKEAQKYVDELCGLGK